MKLPLLDDIDNDTDPWWHWLIIVPAMLILMVSPFVVIGNVVGVDLLFRSIADGPMKPIVVPEPSALSACVTTATAEPTTASP